MRSTAYFIRRFVPDHAVPNRAREIAEHKAAVAAYLASGGPVTVVPPGVMATAPVSLNNWERKTLDRLNDKLNDKMVEKLIERPDKSAEKTGGRK